MKSFVLTVFIALLLPLTTAAAKEQITKELITSENKTRAFYLFVPDAVKVGHPAPMIVLLHGSGRNGNSLVEKWKDLASKEGIILVGPDATNSEAWNVPADGPKFLHELVESLKGKYPIDARRVYLFGHSAGAVFGIFMSLLESEYFAATAIHAGMLPKDSYSMTDLAKRKIPLAIVIGTRDQFFPLALVQATRDLLIEKGFSVEFTEMPGHDHWYYDLAPKINLNAWAFLKKHELPADPHYQSYR
jgi:poly(3-hydroxybutyrate) depolymerase